MILFSFYLLKMLVSNLKMFPFLFYLLKYVVSVLPKPRRSIDENSNKLAKVKSMLNGKLFFLRTPHLLLLLFSTFSIYTICKQKIRFFPLKYFFKQIAHWLVHQMVRSWKHQSCHKIQMIKWSKHRMAPRILHQMNTTISLMQPKRRNVVVHQF